MRWVFLILALVVAAVMARLGLRGEIRERRPMLFVPDMAFQPRYNPQEAGPFFQDGRAMRTPPAGTVAFGGGDYESDAGSPRRNRDMLQDNDHYYRGKKGKDWAADNPFKVDLVLLKRGQERYNIYCAPCHGLGGTGDGIMTRYGMVGVASITDTLHRLMPDGQYFDVITHGKGRMPSYGSQVKIRDRWAIVAYIRALMRSQSGRPEDVPEPERGGRQP